MTYARSYRGGVAAARRRTSRRGQVLVLTLLGLTLLVSLVFYVYNVGGQVNRRTRLQNVADSVAVSGAGWMARSMNVIAMNNCEQTRLLALVPVMDALPLATEMSADEMDAWERGLADQLARPMPATHGDHLRVGIESLRARMAQQRDILMAAKGTLCEGSFEMELSTHWAVRGAGGPVPHGELWKGMVTLDELSEVTAESAGLLAQRNAVRFGEDNRASAAFLMPLVPAIPARRGTFSDFQPVLQGKTGVDNDRAFFSRTGGNGGAIPDFAGPDSQHRMGPWARLFKWRYPRHHREGGTWVPGTGETITVRGTGGGNVKTGGRSVGSSVIQRGRSPGGHWVGGTSVLIGYTAYGPYHWALRHRIDWYANDQGYDHRTRAPRHAGKLADTYFTSYLKKIADIKLTYMFTSKTPKSVHVPLWITDYAQCRSLAEDPETKITETLYYRVEVVSKYPEGSPQWMTPGTFRTNGQYPIATRAKGWVDPASWQIPKIADHIWKDNWTYETTQDRSIGIEPKPVDPNNPDSAFQTVYVVQWFIFGGIDVGGDREISDPCNWDEHDRVPAPIILDPQEGDYDPDLADPDEGYRRKWFMYLGLARMGMPGAAWRERFENPNPTGSMLTVAQAKVFNNTSWDLWTQDWRVRLAPVSKWDSWVAELDQAAGLGGLGSTVPQEELDNAYRYLSALGGRTAEVYTGH